MELTGPQKTKWSRIRGEIIKRPFLAYSIGLTNEDVDRLFSGVIPSQEELDKIDSLLINLRQEKIERLRGTLIKVVGHRGSAQFAEKIGTDSMTIKYIIDKKLTKVPGHDLISKIEIYLSYITDFDVSLEYQNDEKNFVPDKIDELKLKISEVISNLTSLNFNFNKLKSFDKKGKKQPLSDNWEITRLQNVLSTSIDDIQKVKFEVDIIVENLTY